jgi:hypothetical protein
MGSRRKDRELHWREILGRQSASGLSVAAFCRQESVSAPSFYSWKRKLNQRDAPSRKRGSRTANSPQETRAVHLVPVRIESKSSSPIRIFLPQGVSLETNGEIGESALASLLRALREAHGC